MSKHLLVFCLSLLITITASAQTNVVDGPKGDVVLDASDVSTSGVHLRVDSSTPSISAKLGTSSNTSRFAIFDSNNVALLSVRADKYVELGGPWSGDGMPSDASGVGASIKGDAFFGLTGSSVARMRMSSNSAQGFFQWNVYYNGSGLKLLNTTKPGFELEMNGNGDKFEFKRYAPGEGFVSPTAMMTIQRVNGANEVVVHGKLTASQVIGAVYQDIAEWVPATTDMPAGTVVVLNPDGINEVMPSSRAYDTSVAGVVSAQPGVILGEASDSKEQIATYGRVRVRVDATRAPIRVGDLLVTSDKSGVAMRSEPSRIDGRSFHQPGTIIGKALQPLAAGEGEILVLLSLQ